MMLRQVVVGSLLAVVSMGSVADTLWLDNGDRVSGKVEFLDAGKLVLRTEYAGTVSVDIARVRTFTSEEPVPIDLSALSLAPVGSDMGEVKRDDTAQVPNTDHLKLSEE